jgi:hypothetical protein
MGRWAEAIQAFEKVLKVDPLRASAWFHKAVAHYCLRYNLPSSTVCLAGPDTEEQESPTTVPVSDELRDWYMEVVDNKKDGRRVSGVTRGNEPGQVIMLSSEGQVVVELSEDESYIYFQYPSGRRQRARKIDFLRELCEKTGHGPPIGE